MLTNKLSYLFFYMALQLFVVTAVAQPGVYNFQKLTMQEGLYDGMGRCITQDKLGYIWISTVSGLNRFDGKTVKLFTNVPQDSTSPMVGQARSLHTDAAGRMWMGYELGLQQFIYRNSSFKTIEALNNHYVHWMASSGDSILFLATGRGLIRYSVATGIAFNYTTSTNPQLQLLQKNYVHQMVVKEDKLYIASNNGLFVMNIVTNEIKKIPVPVKDVTAYFKIAVDGQNNIWLSTTGISRLIKLSADYKTATAFDALFQQEYNTQPNNISGIMVDAKNTVWVITVADGLLQYNEQNNTFIKHLHSAVYRTSPSSDNYRSIYQDKQGIIWLGTDSRGVNYFHPEKYYFKTILPFPEEKNNDEREVSRAVSEDKDGNLWLGNHDGLSNYNPKTGAYRVWKNKTGSEKTIYSNFIRSVLCDKENNLTWIGTGGGVNRYNHLTGAMEFIQQENLPLSFYNSINKDRSGNIWFCTNDSASVYWYSIAEKKYHNISEHPYLKKFVRFAPASYVYEDTMSRLWISFARRGLVMFDKKTNRIHQYNSGPDPDKYICGNSVIDIEEDRNGMIWVSTFNGLSGINVEKDSVISFTYKNGLIGNYIGPLAIDKQNRLWMGVNGGLMMMDIQTKNFTAYTVSDGLPSVGFPEHAGTLLQNGEIIFPGNYGFIKFNPAHLKEQFEQLKFYLSSYYVFDKEFTSVNGEETNSLIQLGAHENSFTFNLVALNYLNQKQTWFAYRLKGFEEKWHYTKDPKAVYTNIAGGNYTFEFKASTINSNWDKVDAKEIRIQLNTVFYKTTWFIGLMAAFAAIVIYMVYAYRMRKQKQLLELENKAQQLEKEKAMVMYESLKQQLNPHFLFNSLTSLSGLIETNQPVAVKFLEQMSGIYRYILKNASSETVLLKDELSFVQLYINLQQTRFKKGLQVNMNVPDEYLHSRIAPVTLQNMIENAIKHNVIDDESPLVITIYTEEEYLVVKNNLQKKSMVETSNQKGLAQFTNLYAYLSSKPVLIQEDEKHFTIKIPLV
jgi:ligand-binding sensor domain-containing protein